MAVWPKLDRTEGIPLRKRHCATLQQGGYVETLKVGVVSGLQHPLLERGSSCEATLIY